jgi:hypothetical protein
VLSTCTLIAGDAAQAARDADAVLAENRSVGNHFAAFFACITGGITGRRRPRPRSRTALDRAGDAPPARAGHAQPQTLAQLRTSLSASA